jgi:hypothetical protein
MSDNAPLVTSAEGQTLMSSSAELAPVHLRVKPDRRQNPVSFPCELERRLALRTNGYQGVAVGVSPARRASER